MAGVEGGREAAREDERRRDEAPVDRGDVREAARDVEDGAEVVRGLRGEERRGRDELCGARGGEARGRAREAAALHEEAHEAGEVVQDGEADARGGAVERGARGPAVVREEDGRAEREQRRPAVVAEAQHVQAVQLARRGEHERGPRRRDARAREQRERERLRRAVEHGPQRLRAHEVCAARREPVQRRAQVHVARGADRARAVAAQHRVVALAPQERRPVRHVRLPLRVGLHWGAFGEL